MLGFIILTLIIVIFAIWSDYRGCHCSYMSRDQKPGANTCMDLAGCHPNPKDTLSIRVEKSYNALKRLDDTVSWKRALGTAVLCTLLIFYLLQATCPSFSASWFLFLAMTIIIFLITFLSTTWLQNHLNRPVHAYVEKTLSMVEQSSRCPTLQ